MDVDTTLRHRVTILLPHRESFGPTSAGAVAMAVQRIAAGASRHRCLVVGPPVRGPAYPEIDFVAAPVPRFLPLTVTQSYAVKLALVLAPLQPSLIEVHNKPDVAMWLALRFPHRPVMLFLHNDPRDMRGARSPRARTRLLRRLARVVTVSGFLRDALLDGVRAPTGRDPLVIHNALDLPGLPPLLPAGQRENLILFAGRVVPDKAPDVFVTACAQALTQLPGWRAAIIGTDGFSTEVADSAFMRNLRPRAAAAGIEMRGYVPHEEVLQAMARAAIVVVPSRWQEPFGMTALEAMACGAALACSGRGGLAEVAGEVGLRIDPDHPATLTEALLRLAGDSDMRGRLSVAGQQRVASRFAAADALAQLDDVRDAVIGRK